MAGGSKPGERRGGRRKGTPNKATADVKAAAREYGEAAIKRLATLGGLIEGETPAQSEAAQVAACNTILDRAYGKATQPISGDSDAPPVTFQIVSGVPRAED
jgi:hypothetical protein